MHTLKDLLEIAIQAEVNAQKLYQRGVDLVNDKETKQFLNRLVKEETEHEKMLFNILNTGLYDVDTEIKDESLFQTAKTSHGKDTVAYEDDWTVEEILSVALKRELNAKKRYESAAASVDDEELKTLFTNLAYEEASHHKVIDRQYKMFKGIMGEEI